MERIQPGDVFVVWRLDRLGRSLAYVVAMIEWLGQVGIDLRSLGEELDTRAPGGRLVLHIMGALAEFERSLIVERTKAGLAAARQRGAKVGRPRKLSAEHISRARAVLDAGTETRASVARLLAVDPKTLWRALAADES